MIFGIMMFAEIWRRPKLLAQSNKYKSPEGFQVAFEKCEKINFSHLSYCKQDLCNICMSGCITQCFGNKVVVLSKPHELVLLWH